MLTHNHCLVWGGWNGHWHECSICGKKADEGEHVYDGADASVCTVCGDKKDVTTDTGDNVTEETDVPSSTPVSDGVTDTTDVIDDTDIQGSAAVSADKTESGGNKDSDKDKGCTSSVAVGGIIVSALMCLILIWKRKDQTV